MQELRKGHWEESWVGIAEAVLEKIIEMTDTEAEADRIEEEANEENPTQS